MTELVVLAVPRYSSHVAAAWWIDGPLKIHFVVMIMIPHSFWSTSGRSRHKGITSRQLADSNVPSSSSLNFPNLKTCGASPSHLRSVSWARWSSPPNKLLQNKSWGGNSWLWLSESDIFEENKTKTLRCRKESWCTNRFGPANNDNGHQIFDVGFGLHRA